MAGNQWSQIKPSSVPARCLTKYRKAFLNEVTNSTELRANSEERMACREAFLSAASGRTKTKLHGSRAQPHELVAGYIAQALAGDEVQEDLIIEAQWKDMLDRLRKDCPDDLGKLVTLCDLS